MDKSQIELENQIKEAGLQQFSYLVSKYEKSLLLGDIMKSFVSSYMQYIDQYGQGLEVEQKSYFKDLKFSLIDLSVFLNNSFGTKRDITIEIEKVKQLFK